MTESASFIARWLRLKQEADASVQATDPSASPTVDPAHLPPIESITAHTDIRQFLQSGVPAELMRAALRTAWVADPVIRDFIGVSEAQWDFNDPKAMPGFGPLQALDRAASLAARTVSRPEITDPAREAPAGVPASAALDRGDAKVAQPVPFRGTQERQVEAEQPPVRHGRALPKLG